MKSIGILVLILAVFTRALAGNDSFSEGVKAHGEKNYALAAQKFEMAINENPDNISAYFNLGLAEMGDRHYGAAIWAFEKVLKFDPNDSEGLQKLESCQSELQGNTSYTPVLSGFEATLFGISSNTWSILAILSSLLVCACTLGFKLRRGLSIRRVFLIVGFFSLLFLGFTAWTAQRTASYYSANHYGIVTEETIPTYMDPANKASIQLKEGTRVKLLDSDSSDFILVQDNMGHELLVKATDLRYF